MTFIKFDITGNEFIWIDVSKIIWIKGDGNYPFALICVGEERVVTVAESVGCVMKKINPDAVA